MNLRSKVHRFIYEQHWTIGFIEQPLSDIVQDKPLEIRYVKNMPKECWFADPFILDYDDSIIQLLVEEFNYAIRKGRIAKVLIDRNSYAVIGYKVVLELQSHLSFPFIYRNEGRVFVCPENSASGSWNMYEYNKDGDTLTFIKRLSELPLTDAIFTSRVGNPLIFSTYIPVQNGDTLSVFNMVGQKTKAITFKSNIGRNAGDWFNIGTSVYRPAQDCNGDYGKAIIIQSVENNGDDFTFLDVRRIESTNPKFTTGCHTFNNYRDLTVVDVHGYRHYGWARVVNFIRGKRK